MHQMSENYNLRKHYLGTDQVPTQSMMWKKMSPKLAAVYFKNMSSKLKVLAGLEPIMKGGGSDWYIPPKNLLEGRAVLKPEKKECLQKLNYLGIDTIGIEMLNLRMQEMSKEKKNKLKENDLLWKQHISTIVDDLFKKNSLEASQNNTTEIKKTFREFTTLYKTSIVKIESILLEAAVKEIERTRHAALQQMRVKYHRFLKQQAIKLSEEYDMKLNKEQERLKEKFKEDLEQKRFETSQKIHDLKVDKHAAIASVRQFLESQKLACNIYVALKEREECCKNMDLATEKHMKRIKLLNEELARKDFEIHANKNKEQKRQEFHKVWEEKVFLVVQKLKMFVSYCLTALPEYADFFIKIEELMLSQLSEVLENPNSESSFTYETETKDDGPKPKPHPFYICWDKGNKPQIEQDLCPNHCTSSASRLPVILINKRCLYAACDNLEQFTEKCRQFVNGKRGDDVDFDDHQVYSNYVPVRHSSSQQLLDMKLESSLLQVLKQELAIREESPVMCPYCKMYNCLCCASTQSKTLVSFKSLQRLPTTVSKAMQSPKEMNSQEFAMELEHAIEPKVESYLQYIESKKCSCAKTNKNLFETRLPPYMKNKSRYDAPDLYNYETCPRDTLKELIRKSRPKIDVGNVRSIEDIPSNTKDVGTQYSNPELDTLCKCFSVDEIESLLAKRKAVSDSDRFSIVDGSVSNSTNLQTKSSALFMTDMKHSLMSLVEDPGLLEIFFKAQLPANL